jgi:4-amino-4-deoxy-L-arabinose transferase-like glycosyltransferase
MNPEIAFYLGVIVGAALCLPWCVLIDWRTRRAMKR